MTPGTAVRFDPNDSPDAIGTADYEWAFGDGTNATGVAATHDYADLGNDTVS